MIPKLTSTEPCNVFKEHDLQGKYFSNIDLSALPNRSAGKSDGCKNEVFIRALHVTIEFSKRARLFD